MKYKNNENLNMQYFLLYNNIFSLSLINSTFAGKEKSSMLVEPLSTMMIFFTCGKREEIAFCKSVRVGL